MKRGAHRRLSSPVLVDPGVVPRLHGEGFAGRLRAAQRAHVGAAARAAPALPHEQGGDERHEEHTAGGGADDRGYEGSTAPVADAAGLVARGGDPLDFEAFRAGQFGGTLSKGGASGDASESASESASLDNGGV